METSIDKLADIASSEGWSSHEEIGKGRALLLKCDVESWCRRNAGGLFTRQLAKLLGLSATTLTALAERGVFGPDAQERKILLGRWFLTQSEFTRFNDMLTRQIDLQADDLQPWHMYTGVLEMRPLTIVDVIEGVIKRKVRIGLVPTLPFTLTS